jgi:hypothetical protein
MSHGNEAAIDGSKETSVQQDAQKNPVVNFYDLIENGAIVRSSHRFTGYDARLTIRHPNGNAYEVLAWNDGQCSDAEADADDVVFDSPADDKESPQFLIEVAAYDRENDESVLRHAASLVIASWENRNLAAAVNELSDALRERP